MGSVIIDLDKWTLPQKPSQAIAPQLWTESFEPLPDPCWNADWLDLVQGATATILIKVTVQDTLHSILTPNRELYSALGTE